MCGRIIHTGQVIPAIRVGRIVGDGSGGVIITRIPVEHRHRERAGIVTQLKEKAAYLIAVDTDEGLEAVCPAQLYASRDRETVCGINDRLLDIDKTAWFSREYQSLLSYQTSTPAGITDQLTAVSFAGTVGDIRIRSVFKIPLRDKMVVLYGRRSNGIDSRAR